MSSEYEIMPDIIVTDAGAPAGHVTVTVDGHQTIATPDEAKQVIADAYGN